MDRDVFVQALKRLDPSRPAVGAEVKPRPEWDRFDDVLLQVLAGNRPRYALHGSVGVGKTTELMSWKVRMSVNGIDTLYREFRPGQDDPKVFPRDGLNPHVRLLLLDGLDLLPERAPDWFGPGGGLLAPELPALVAVAPHAMSRWPTDRRDPKLTLLHLPPFPVLDRSARAHWPAVEALTELLGARIRDLDILQENGILARVALMSGGVPRDAVRILRAAVLWAARDRRKIAVRDVVAGERELRQDLEQGFVWSSVSNDYDVLRALFGLHRFLESDPRLLTMGAVLSYEDAEGVYALPHPVLFSALGRDEDLRLDAAVAVSGT